MNIKAGRSLHFTFLAFVSCTFKITFALCLVHEEAKTWISARANSSALIRPNRNYPFKN